MRSREDNIKMCFKEMVCEPVGWIVVAENEKPCWAAVNTVTDCRIVWKVENILTCSANIWKDLKFQK
jgi:hypothetical protein